MKLLFLIPALILLTVSVVDRYRSRRAKQIISLNRWLLEQSRDCMYDRLERR